MLGGKVCYVGVSMSLKSAHMPAPSRTQKTGGGVARARPADPVHALAQMARNSGPVQRQKHLQQMADTVVASHAGVVQRALFANPKYAPTDTTRPEFEALDSKVAEAAENARAAVTAVDGTPDTPKQINWKVHPSPTTWGYVVEEQLDGMAADLGWDTQVVIAGGRPDYKKDVEGATLFADLTTIGQSGDGGPHIGGKLAVAYAALAAQGVAPAWHAADIVHDGAQPGQAAAEFTPNGEASDEHRLTFARFKAAIQEDNFDPWAHAMISRYGEGLSHGQFYAQYDEADRDAFVHFAELCEPQPEHSAPGKVRETRGRAARRTAANPY